MTKNDEKDLEVKDNKEKDSKDLNSKNLDDTENEVIDEIDSDLEADENASDKEGEIASTDDNIDEGDLVEENNAEDEIEDDELEEIVDEEATAPSDDDVSSTELVAELNAPQAKPNAGGFLVGGLVGVVIGALVFGAIILITGGSFSSSNLGENSTIVSTKHGDITNNDLFLLLKQNSGKQAIPQLVLQKIIIDKYPPSEKDIEKAYERETESFKTDEDLNKFFYERGLESKDEYKETLRATLAFENFEKSVKVTDEDRQKYYDDNADSIKEDRKIAHILVDTEEEAKSLKSKLDSGADFAELAKEFSKDSSSEQGGFVGYANESSSSWVPEFANAVKDLGLNEITAPVKTDFGYHIITVTEIKPKPTLEEMKDEIDANVKNEKTNKLVVKLIDEAKIKYNSKLYDQVVEDAVKNIR